MERRAFKLTIQAGTEEEYIRRHKEVFPALLEVFREVGIHTYSIFMDGCTLFAYMEVDDFKEAMHFLNQHPANIQWQAYMSDILLRNDEGQTMEPLNEVFFFSPEHD